MFLEFPEQWLSILKYFVFVKNIIDRENKLTEFFESDKFNGLLAIIKKHDRINQEDLIYKTKVIDGLSTDDFKDVFEAVYQELDSKRVKESDTSSWSINFPQYHIDYKGLRFHLMIGQGSAYWTTKLT